MIPHPIQGLESTFAEPRDPRRQCQCPIQREEEERLRGSLAGV
jgi:hypothetical protein